MAELFAGAGEELGHLRRTDVVLAEPQPDEQGPELRRLPQHLGGELRRLEDVLQIAGAAGVVVDAALVDHQG